jgi:hypothetical protein
VIVAVLVAVFVALITIPVPHGFSDQIYSSALGNSQGNASITPPGGAKVSGTWSAPDPDTNFQIRYDGSVGPDIFSAGTANGSFSFTAVYYEYWFVVGSSANETVSVSGSYLSPII